MKEVLAEIEAEREAGQRYDRLRVAAWIKAEQTGTLPPAPVEPSRAVLLAQARDSWGERGEP